MSHHPVSVSNIHVKPLADPLVTTEARRYSLHQLALRAGISREWLRTWRIEHLPTETVVYPVPDRPSRRIRFRHARPDHWEAVRRGHIDVAHVALPEGMTDRQYPDIVVPFVDDQDAASLFRFDGSEAQCSIDLLASVVLTLSRYEETFPCPRDQHDRFPAEASLAVIHDFTHRPIVDEYGSALQYVLRRLLPEWQPLQRQFRAHLTHDVDEIGIPTTPRKIAKRLVLNGLRAAKREVVSLAGGTPGALAAVLDITAVAARYHLGCAVYWKASTPGDFDSGYNIDDRRVKEVVYALRDAGVELGVHPGYLTFLDPARLGVEVERASRSFGTGQAVGGRQHFLRWAPQSWRDWERCGLAYDSSVGFSDRVGFRAGTCHPYRPWLIAENREANLLEVPLIAMDCALTGAMGLRGDACVRALREAIRACQDVGGVFTLLWHTDSILDPVYGDCYERVVNHLAGQPSFDWRTDSANTISTAV